MVRRRREGSSTGDEAEHMPMWTKPNFGGIEATVPPVEASWGIFNARAQLHRFQAMARRRRTM